MEQPEDAHVDEAEVEDLTRRMCELEEALAGDSALTQRQRFFVQNYIIDFNGTQAALRAGFTSNANSAGVWAHTLLRQTKIRAAVERAKAERIARINMSADEVVNELAVLANSCVGHYALDDFGNLTLAPGAPAGAMGAVKSVRKKIRHGKDGEITYETSFELWDKPGQLKLMGKHTGVKACAERMEVSGPDGGPIPVTEVRSVVVDPKATDG